VTIETDCHEINWQQVAHVSYQKRVAGQILAEEPHGHAAFDSGAPAKRPGSVHVGFAARASTFDSGQVMDKPVRRNAKVLLARFWDNLLDAGNATK
jgi:hypothetical protein